MASYQTNESAEQRGLAWLFSSTAACLVLLLVAWACIQVGVVRLYESDYFHFWRDFFQNFFDYGVNTVEGWFAFFVLIGPMIAIVIVLLGPAMSSKARAGVIFLGTLSTWGWIVYFLVHSEWYEGQNWFGDSLKALFLSETDTWGSVGNWIYLGLLILSLAHLLTPSSAPPPAREDKVMV